MRAWAASWKDEWSRLKDARLSIIPIALGVLVMSFSQGVDVVRDLVDSSNLYIHSSGRWSDAALASYFRWGCFWGACVWSGLNAWYWPHLITLSRTAEREPCWFLVLRRTLGTIPVFAGLITICVAIWARLADIWIAVLLFGLTSLLLPVLYVYRLKLARHFLADSWWRKESVIMETALIKFGGRKDIKLTLGDDAFALFTFFMSFVVLMLFAFPVVRIEFATHVGSASIAFGAVGSMIATFSALVWILSGTRLPVIAGSLVAVLLFSFVNDTHRIDVVPSDLIAHRKTVQQAYTRWLTHNPDGPLILVATAGGASRAGYWTGEVLRALDDRTSGAFGRQVFAISSVSGGTLGAIGYAAWRADHPTDAHCPYSPGERRTFDRDFLGGDYLSPAIGGLLYPDLTQLWVPGPLFDDRARSLEESWERGWAAAADNDTGCARSARDRFRTDYMEIWRSSLFGDGPWVPIVFANGTLVEDGKRVITAPVQVDSTIFEDSHEFASLLGPSVTASTAVLNSARFPLVSPAGTIPVQGGSLHIVDGGYFENGGLETVYDLARYLRTIIPQQRKILIIEINNDDAAPGDPYTVDDLGRYPNGMAPSGASRINLKVASPEPVPWYKGMAQGPRSVIGAFYETRTSRGVLGAKRLSSLQAIGLTNTYRATFNLGPLLKGRKTAMSWSLSLSSRQAMDGALQNPNQWRDTPTEKQVTYDPKSAVDIACERSAADEIASAIGATVVREPLTCPVGSDNAQRIGVPIGLGVADAPKAPGTTGLAPARH